MGLLVGVAVGGAGGLLVNVARRRGWVADGFARRSGAGPGGMCLRNCGGAARQRVHRGICRRARVRHGRWPARRAAGAVRRGNRRPGVLAGLAGVRRCRGGTGGGEPDLADRAVCGPQPHGDPDGAGGGGTGRGSTGPRSPWWAGSVPGAWRRWYSPCLRWRNWVAPLPTTPSTSSRSPSCSASSSTVPRPIRWPPGTHNTSPVRQARMTGPKCRAYGSAGSSAGLSPAHAARGVARIHPRKGEKSLPR